MTESLRALLSNTIDYAGLFPPASLAMHEAVARYESYRHSADCWLLARFVCPARRLRDLDLVPQSMHSIAAVAKAAETVERFFDDLADDLATVVAFGDKHGGRPRIELLECSLPKRVATQMDSQELIAFFRALADHLRRAAPQLSAVMIEPVLDANWPRRIPLLTTALATARNRSPPEHHPHESTEPRLGFKLRMGGPMAESYPTSQQVALFIACCRDVPLRWKATAGLHQPLSHLDPATGAAAHGFLNLFAATAMATVHDLSVFQIQAILDGRRAEDFVFYDDGFRWKNWEVSTPQIQKMRTESLGSFGSCSFDEPLDGLRQLGWLKGASR